MMRALGVDDGYFGSRSGTAPFVGVLMRGPLVEGIVFRRITVDGLDVTEVLEEVLTRTKYSDQVRVVFTSGTVFGGTNVLDMRRVYDSCGLPVISVMRRPPGRGFRRAMERSPNAPAVLEILERNPPVERLETGRGTLFVQYIGMGPADVKRVVEDYQIYSALPEPLRLAHMIASAVGLGESRGRP
ncbi:TPA: DUF99 family protein [Candidatus Micrarchaeota archaeon]|nr:DUF99 family protein [Candidatus Micrarchaeota archaeon]